MLLIYHQVSRQHLGWFEQKDAHSCGPLAFLGDLCLRMGVKPSPAMLGFKSVAFGPLEAKSARALAANLMIEHIGRDV